MIEKLTLVLVILIVLAKVIPKARYISDHKGKRIIVEYKKWMSNPDTLDEGYYLVIHQFWLTMNKEWWDKFKEKEQ